MISLFYLLAYRGGDVEPGDDMAGSQFRWWSWEEILKGRLPMSVPSEPWIIQRAVELYRL